MKEMRRRKLFTPSSDPNILCLSTHLSLRRRYAGRKKKRGVSHRPCVFFFFLALHLQDLEDDARRGVCLHELVVQEYVCTVPSHGDVSIAPKLAGLLLSIYLFPLLGWPMHFYISISLTLFSLPLFFHFLSFSLGFLFYDWLRPSTFHFHFQFHFRWYSHSHSHFEFTCANAFSDLCPSWGETRMYSVILQIQALYAFNPFRFFNLAISLPIFLVPNKSSIIAISIYLCPEQENETSLRIHTDTHKRDYLLPLFFY